MNTGEYKVQNFKKLESAYIESVRALGSDDGKEPLNKVATANSNNFVRSRTLDFLDGNLSFNSRIPIIADDENENKKLFFKKNSL